MMAKHCNKNQMALKSHLVQVEVIWDTYFATVSQFILENYTICLEVLNNRD